MANLDINNNSRKIENISSDYDGKYILIFDENNLYKLPLKWFAGQRNGSAEIFNDYNNRATKNYSHAEGQGTIADGECQHVEGKYNVQMNNNYLHVVGNGSVNKRSNAHTLDKDGNAWFSGNINFGSNEGPQINLRETINKLQNKIHKGEGTPSPTLGNVGDIYCQILSSTEG